MTNQDGFVHPPLLTGRYAVGRSDVIVSDFLREDPHALTKDIRHLSLNIFSPQLEDKKNLHPYDEGAISYWKQATYWTPEQRNILDQSLEQFRCYANPNSTLSDLSIKQKPIILFSHGFMAFGTLYSFLLEELASHGFTVVAINHTHAASYAKLKTETVYGHMTHRDLFATPYAEEEQKIWIDDCLFVIGEIKKGKVQPLCEKKDFSFITMGHSFGGSTAIHVAQQSPAVGGCINLDGALFGKNAVTDLQKPCLILKAEESVREMTSLIAIAELSQKLSIRLEDSERFKTCYTDRLDELAKKSSQVITKLVKGINHMAFTDFNFLNQSPLFQHAYVGSKASESIIKEIREEVLLFLCSVC